MKRLILIKFAQKYLGKISIILIVNSDEVWDLDLLLFFA